MTEHEPQSAQEFEHYNQHYIRDIEEIVRTATDSAT